MDVTVCPYNVGDFVTIRNAEELVALYESCEMFSTPDQFLTDVAGKEVCIADISECSDFNEGIDAKWSFSCICEGGL